MAEGDGAARHHDAGDRSVRAVQPTLSKHADRFPTEAKLKNLVASGQPAYGMGAVGEGKLSSGAELLMQAADRDDPRPLWVTVWGGANTLAQALWQVRATRSPDELDRFVSKLRVYSISDQDDAAVDPAGVSGAVLHREPVLA